MASSTPGSTCPITGTWLPPWTPAPIRAALGGRPEIAGAHARIATPEIAAVRWAVIGPASRIPVGTPVCASLSSRIPWIAGSPRALLAWKPRTHFMPRRSASPVAPGMNAGIACANEPSGRRVHADLGRQLGRAGEAAKGLRGELEAGLEGVASRPSRPPR